MALWAGGRFPASDVVPYVVVQVAGAIAGAAVLYVIASGNADFNVAGGMASNGYGEHSPGKHSLVCGLVTEIVVTFMFLVIILGTTHKRARVGFAGIAIGLALTLIHPISIPVTDRARLRSEAIVGPDLGTAPPVARTPAPAARAGGAPPALQPTSI